MTPRAFPCFTSIAEHGLLVEFGDRFTPAINARVRALDHALTAAPFPGYLEAVPAYVSLLIRFDPLVTDHAAAEAAARHLLDRADLPARTPQRHEISVCYDPDLAPDLDSVASLTGLSTDAVIAAHLAGHYEVVMYGFAPGYAYLAGVPEPLHLPRKASAVRGVAAGSVLIAGPQCLVSTLTMPTGWWVIGRSPARILTGDSVRPFLFDVGDHLRFTRIHRAAYEAQA